MTTITADPDVPAELSDVTGATRDRAEVEEIAFRNVMGSMSLHELALSYVVTMSDGELVQWATDEEGRFPE